jgi:hypothetical protein
MSSERNRVNRFSIDSMESKDPYVRHRMVGEGFHFRRNGSPASFKCEHIRVPEGRASLAQRESAGWAGR